MKINDCVTRKKYNNDIVFKIIDIKDNLYILQGVNIRLTATAFKEDLNLTSNIIKEEYDDLIEQNRSLSLKKGKILHLDGDESYLKKCLEVYKKNNVEAVGFYLSEKDMKHQVTNLLIEHKPDVLVITGHDSQNEYGEYLNSDAFASCVKSARIFTPDKDSLVIFAGACQSEYNKLIASGANFATSTSNSNIHILDPVLIAIQVASTPVQEYVDVDKVLKRTISKGKGLGGIDTRGVARRIYGGK